ncbi:multidrug efflux RND transporter permease subunit [Paracidovorax citrulli]|uniref:multidrug efflux RND transporter permease subunit n=1 Tax=Paracidovorax citrulli TaxID=80869 RepID=UPI00066249A8|nr:multidrug efflux RND transporter permease subunit [Paracidovorax citrulli]QCX09023.1 Multidrug resistance protein MexB [Paracidovorax citrulli]UEG48235.1 multidrug efflux RND transporter permease subunit [Paracidovorax citrulli]UMT88552.1 multidrug efflux RND transporter permease subunit [Paracidovorax citrulli]UMT96511.1 multidrug efflux RND transporter permease subunit [Paracidovorax citrulli]WIY36818.1 multidrug efflux RND transporter permease subunit [Paracidovorax citrulli]
MPQFFIRRPVFAWVIALFIVLFGAIAIPQLPIARYPAVAPPAVSLFASYPGATPQTLNDSVVSLIERELSGVKNLLYFESSVDTSGSAQITATFKPGTNPELAQVDVQNRIKAVEPRLPQAVRQSGLQVESAASGFLMLIGMTSRDGRYDEVGLNDYMARNIVQELRRIDGVGRVQLFGAEQAMRVWVDPARLLSYGLAMGDVTQAIEQQNAQVAPGRVGDAPTLPGQRVTVPLTVQGQLSTPEQFAAIVLKAGADGSKVVLRDVARVELGAQSYAFANRENGRVATSAAIQLSPGANAVRTAQAVQDRLAELARTMPAGMEVSVPFNTAPFVKISIEKVLHTLAEAMVLVFAVMFLFLQNIRYTLIPAIVAPIALLGTFTVMLVAGFSINVLTMFGMVLAIGIIVDDAIVVVENVERLMAAEGLSPRDATVRAMREITGAVVGITLVLTAVFIPMAFATGSVGVIYRQFTLSMAVSILFSAFLALTLTPALCATLLRPVDPGHHERRGFFGAFNRGFDRLSRGYAARVARLAGRSGRMMVAFALVCAVLVLAARQLPSSFLPEEDQGYFMTSIQLPTGATSERTLDVVKAFESHVASRPGLASNMVIQGFSFSGSGPNAAMAFTMLKDWNQRDGASARDESERAQDAMRHTPEGTVMSLLPPAIDELGTSSGFTMFLQDRAGRGAEALAAAQARLMELAAQSPLLRNVYPDGLPPGGSVRLDIDRRKAEAMGLSFNAISTTLSAAMGSAYVNDFPNAGRMQQVIVQADAPARMQLGDVLKLRVRNAAGGLVPLGEVATPVWTESPQQMMRFQGFPAARIAGGAAPGVSSGAAMAEMERLVAQLPLGFAAAWTGQSLQERQSAAQAPLLMALSALVVFLVLAALYESWSIPLAVMLVVPLGLVGAVAAVMLRGLPNDVFFKVGMITIIGLSAKNAILIVEFARQLHSEGRGLLDAAVTAARLRLRPILMTSLAFALGVVPLMLASGASAETQHAIGTGVFGGMVSGTVLAVFFVPAFFVFVMGLQERVVAWRARRRPPEALPAPAGAPAVPTTGGQ